MKKNHQNDINKAYISPIDYFLYAFDQSHEKTASQQAEIKKYQRITYLRDDAHPVEQVEIIWEDF